MFEVIVMVATLGQLSPPAMPGFTPRPTLPYAVPQPVRDIKVEASRVPDTTDAVAWAVQDIMLRPAADRPFLQYLWVPPWGSIAWHQANSFLVNSAVSQSSVIALPEGVAGGWMMVWDLRKLAPKDADLQRLLIVRNALSFKEPYFHLELPKGQAVACRQYQHIDGKIYHARRFVPAPHVAQGYALLEQETLSFAPLLRADDFLRRIASTVDGGLYYHAIGFITNGKRLTEKEIFRLVGLDVALSREVEGDDRAAMFQSGVTGKPRMIEQVQGAVGKARITYDVFDEDVDADRHAVYELLDMVNRARGKELIYERPNGLLGYFLTDGEGKLVDVAPPNLVSDHQTPAPVTKQLYPPLSCIRCHGQNAGVQIIRNDVTTLLASGRDGDVDVFDDLSNRSTNRFATVDRLAGLFAASDKFYNDIALQRVRYADAVWTATRGMAVEGKDNVTIKTSKELADQYAKYWYPTGLSQGNVSADQAAMELGHKVTKEGEGAAFLRQTLKPGRVDFVVDGVPVESADPSLAALRRGLTIRRQDFERIYAYAAYQISQSRKVESK